MEVTLNIRDKSKAPFLMELLNSLDYVAGVKEVTKKRESQVVSDLREALMEVKLHKQGKIKLQTADEFLNGL
jgi:hypothetical protein